MKKIRYFFTIKMVALSIWEQAVNEFGEQCNEGDRILVQRTVRNRRVTVYSIERVGEQLLRHISIYDLGNEPMDFTFDFTL
jgi:hypothetical protein